ncbi:hypothetical protein [Almyronema epifaneia]|uniref:Uncharacterized protein n=1 Tax=Almyronema epifaneia S1 TaxID=2991925 RepID=A0ABW6ICN5_9CYAN
MSIQLPSTLNSRQNQRWLTTLFMPAILFWVGGLVAFIDRFGFDTLVALLNKQSVIAQIIILFATFLTILASAFFVQSFDSKVLYFLQGYWPNYLQPLHRTLVRRHKKRRYEIEHAFQVLARRSMEGNLSPIERTFFVQIDTKLQKSPPVQDLMPTQLGNIMKSAEHRIVSKYGLDASICLPRLWLILPETVRQTFQETRFNLNDIARVWLWGILFNVWVMFSAWPLIIGFLVTLFSYSHLLEVAGEFGSLLESLFDVYRIDLYKHIRWPLPRNPEEERKLGSALTQYFWRGVASSHPDFNYES